MRQLVTQGIAQGGLVMVMNLSEDIVSKSKANPNLATMPRDKETTSRAAKNDQDLKYLNRGGQTTIILDTTNCDSLAVSSKYLVERIPFITKDESEQLISQLKQGGHINQFTNILEVDPTKSNWRTIISPNNSTHRLGKFVVKPGYSPLAKALYRCWTFHEYCSEVVFPALDLFEMQQS